MGATETVWDVTPDVIALCLDALVVALSQRGLAAECFGTTMVRARNSAADPDGDDLQALRGPGLRQTVACRKNDTGQLSWFWLWAGPTRDAPPELEYLAPAGHIAEAADRIANVLRLDGADREPAA